MTCGLHPRCLCCDDAVFSHPLLPVSNFLRLFGFGAFEISVFGGVGLWDFRVSGFGALGVKAFRL